jgi:hypothetical protein
MLKPLQIILGFFTISTLLVLGSFSVGPEKIIDKNLGARTSNFFNVRNNSYIETTKPTGWDWLINGVNKYLNFNLISGSSGYGFRDNGGDIEFKDSGGSWIALNAAGGLDASAFSAIAPLTILTTTTTVEYGITQASSTGDGYLSSTDWNTFNNKVGGLTDLTLPENYLYVGNSSNKPEATNSLIINSDGDLIPLVDNTQELGSTTKTFSDFHFTNELGEYATARRLLLLHKTYSEEAAILPFTISNSVSGGVWTITVTASDASGDLRFVLDGKALLAPSSTLSVNATSYAGTDTLPKTVYIYVQNNGSDVPELIASNTDPNGIVNHVHVAEYKAGTISPTHVTSYGKVDSVVEMYRIASNNFYRLLDEGPIYKTGLNIDASSSDVTIGAGTYKVVYDLISSVSRQVSSDSLFFVKNDGTYATSTGFDFDNEYSDGVTINTNRFYNVVLGVLENDTTKIMALVQTGSAGEYLTFTGAFKDENNQTVSMPSDNLLKNIFVPVARIIVQSTVGGYVLQQFPTGLYYRDLRGDVSVSGGSGIASNIIDGTADGQMTFWNNTLGEWNYTETSELFWDDTNKRLGIGETTPLYSLDVNGNIRITDTATTTNMSILGWLKDGDGDKGTAGQVLSYDGTNLNWINAGAGTVTNIWDCSGGDCNQIAMDTGEYLDASDGEFILPMSSGTTTEGAINWEPGFNQLQIYNGDATSTILSEITKCAVVENLAAADDNMSLGSVFATSTVKKVWCHYKGTGTTVAQISLEDGSGNAMTHTTPTCTAQGTPPARQTVTAGGGLNQNELVAFDVDNAVSPETDTYTICVTYEYDSQ